MHDTINQLARRGAEVLLVFVDPDSEAGRALRPAVRRVELSVSARPRGFNRIAEFVGRPDAASVSRALRLQSGIRGTTPCSHCCSSWSRPTL